MRFKEADPLREANKSGPSSNNAGKVRAKLSGRAALPSRLPIEWLDPMSWRLPSGQALDAQAVSAAVAVLDAIDARVAALRQELSAEAVRTTSQLHELKSVGGRAEAGSNSLTRPVVSAGVTTSLLEESAEVVRRFLAEGADLC